MSKLDSQYDVLNGQEAETELHGQHSIPDTPISGKASAILLDLCNSGPRSEPAMLMAWANITCPATNPLLAFPRRGARQAAMVLHKLVEVNRIC